VYQQKPRGKHILGAVVRSKLELVVRCKLELVVRSKLEMGVWSKLVVVARVVGVWV
jgi:hypothetical protein